MGSRPSKRKPFTEHQQPLPRQASQAGTLGGPTDSGPGPLSNGMVGQGRSEQAVVAPDLTYGRTFADLGHEVINKEELFYILPPLLLFLVAAWNGNLKNANEFLVLGLAAMFLDVLTFAVFRFFHWWSK